MRLIILFSLILSVLAVSSDRVFLSSADELKANLLVYDNPIDDFAVSVRQPLNIPIADNDGPNRPGWVYLDLIQNVQHGFLANQGGYYQTFSYAPTPGFSGVDSFTYRYYNLENPTINTGNATVVILVHDQDDAENAGRSCGVGQPVNVTNGNMWLEQRDYYLPGLGNQIDVNRFYNSIIQRSGLFGFGWTTKYDESLTIYPDNKMLRFTAADGKASYFARLTTSGPFKSYSPGNDEKILKNIDETYSLISKDGSESRFSITGRLLWQRDRNGNQTTLGYDNSGLLVQISDPAGRTLTLTNNVNGNVTQLADAMGIIASYEYYPQTESNPLKSLLKTVVYNDGSKYHFEYDSTSASSKTLLKTVKDAPGNILETHLFDSQGRALTSERHGGVEKYTLEFDQFDQNLGFFTKVTDARLNVTKYFHKRKYETNLITRTEGACSCGGGSQVVKFEYDQSISGLNLVKKN